MAEMSAADARKNLAEVLNTVAYGKKRVVLSRRGKGIAALVQVEDLELLEKLEARVKGEDIRNALSDVRKKGAQAWERMKKKLGITGHAIAVKMKRRIAVKPPQ